MARHAPGIGPADLRAMTPEETRRLVETVHKDVELERRFHLELAIGVMRASGARVSI